MLEGTDPFAGVLVWIWNLPNCEGGDSAAIVKRLLDTGCAGALIKDTDGGQEFLTNSWAQVKELIGALRAAGLSAITWGYCYDYNEPAEAAIQIQAIQANQPDARVIDTEQEFEQAKRKVGDATALANAIRSAAPTLPLAYCPIGSIRNHLSFPYRQFTDAGLRMVPMAYYTMFGWTPGATLADLYSDVMQYDLAQQPIYPAYADAPLAGYGSTLADVQTFAQTAKKAGATGISVWDYEHLDDAGWSRVAEVAKVFPRTNPSPPPPIPPTPTNDDLVQCMRYLMADPVDMAGLIAYAQRFV